MNLRMDTAKQVEVAATRKGGLEVEVVMGGTVASQQVSMENKRDKEAIKKGTIFICSHQVTRKHAVEHFDIKTDLDRNSR